MLTGEVELESASTENVVGVDNGTTVEAPAAGAVNLPTTVGDMVIEVATVNGTGSQSANLVLARAIFQMGAPVGVKNFVPSNIQGRPTWFDIRVSSAGWVGRRLEPDLLVAMNVESVADDIKKLRPGAVLVLDEQLRPFLNRTDLITYVVPFDKLVEPVCSDVRLRRMVVNMGYVGVVTWLLSIDLGEVEKAIGKQFAGKPKAVETNTAAARVCYEWASRHCDRRHGLRIERVPQTIRRIFVDGNTAAAIGFLFGGVQVVGWYPITPSTDLVESLTELLQRYRHDPASDKATYAVIQTEDEMASLALVLGASWAGARAMTATSGPGLSLMAELAGLAYFAELPAVICDVQRLGPSTGLPTRTAQGDIIKCYFLSHSDCRHILLIPGSVEECYEFAAESLNLADRFQTPVFLMLDLDLAINHWVSSEFKPLGKPIDRGKVLTASDLDRLGEFKRYADVDGDGIPYRTLPGTRHPLAAYFTRGSGHTVNATYSERAEDVLEISNRLARKFETARRELPPPLIRTAPSGKSDIGIIAYGSSEPAVEEARFLLQEEAGISTDYLRIRALPAHALVREFLANHRLTYLVEQNRDAQMASILKMEWPAEASRIKSVLHYDGLPIHACFIRDTIVASEREVN